MKYTIEGFSQEYATTLKKVIIRKNKEVLIQIDCTDLVILRWFVDFYPNIKKCTIEGKEYGWVSHNKLIEDLPLVNISRQSFIDRMQKLVEFNILTYKLLKEEGNKSVYGFGENYTYLIDSTRVIGSNQQGLLGQTNNNNSINNNSINNKENIIKDFSDSPNQNLSSNNKLESFSTFDLENESPSSKYNCTNEGNNICSSSTVGEGNQTVSLDSGEKKISTYTINIVEHWNKLGEPKCTKITEELDKIVKKALKDYTEEEIKTAITNYKTVLHDKSYFFSYSWNIQKFLKQSNCLDDFTTQGEKWVNYCNQKGLNLDRNDTKKYETNENGVYSV